VDCRKQARDRENIVAVIALAIGCRLYKVAALSADHGNDVSLSRACFLQSTKHASQGLSHRAASKVVPSGNLQHVFLDYAGGDTQILRIGTVIEQKIFAKIS